jgi:hypothetical protein
MHFLISPNEHQPVLWRCIEVPRYLFLFLLTVVLLWVQDGFAAEEPFVVAQTGCSRAHCDTRNSDQANSPVPLGAVGIRWHDTIPSGSSAGLGCSSNGSVVACTYVNAGGDNLVVYDGNGSRLWASGSNLNATAAASAAMVAVDGSVIAADNRSLLRFRPNGEVAWKTATPGGIPISPVISDAGIIVLATKGGPVSAYRNTDGALIGQLWIKESPEDTNFFDTTNTPAIRGERVYISTARINDPNHTAWFVAVDIDVTNTAEPLRIKWRFVFGGPSGGSPLRLGNTLYFDGERRYPGAPRSPLLFSVRDNGDFGTLIWNRRTEGSILASPSADLRGGIWVFPAFRTYLLRLDEKTGAELERADLSALIGGVDKPMPSSVMTQAGDPSRPVMIVGAVSRFISGPTWVVALDLNAHTLAWKVQLATDRSVDCNFSISRGKLENSKMWFLIFQYVAVWSL